jgi:hypothetical protein
MSIHPQGSLKNNNNSSILNNKSVVHHSSCRRKPVKSSKMDANQCYESEKDKFWQWDMLANTSSSRGKRSSILDLSGIIPVSGNRTMNTQNTLVKKNSVNVPNYRSSSKNKFCMSNRANLREMKTSEQKPANSSDNFTFSDDAKTMFRRCDYQTNPKGWKKSKCDLGSMSFHNPKQGKNDSRCCISAIGMYTHYLNNSIGDSEELIEGIKKKKVKQVCIFTLCFYDHKCLILIIFTLGCYRTV